jgi:hypothetical protein
VYILVAMYAILLTDPLEILEQAGQFAFRGMTIQAFHKAVLSFQSESGPVVLEHTIQPLERILSVAIGAACPQISLVDIRVTGCTIIVLNTLENLEFLVVPDGFFMTGNTIQFPVGPFERIVGFIVAEVGRRGKLIHAVAGKTIIVERTLMEVFMATQAVGTQSKESTRSFT